VYLPREAVVSETLPGKSEGGGGGRCKEAGGRSATLLALWGKKKEVFEGWREKGWSERPGWRLSMGDSVRTRK